MTNVTIRVDDTTIKAATEKYGAKVTGFQAAAEGYFEIQKRTLLELKGVFNTAELSAILDNMNGVMLTRQFQANKEMFWAHLQDGNTYEGLFEKWQIDANVLREKILSLSAAQVFFLQEEAYLFWYSDKKFGIKELKSFTENLS